MRWWVWASVVLVLGGVPVRGVAAPMSSAGPILSEMTKQLEDQTLPAEERLQVIRVFETWATEQVRPPLVAALKDPLPEIRAAAARALGWAGNDQAVPALRERVDASGEVPAVRAAALRSLGHIGDRSARALVVAATHDPDASIREAAVWSVALGTLAEPGDRTTYLIQFASDRDFDPQLRSEAVRTLAGIKEERVAVALTRILESEPRMTIALPPGRASAEQTMALRYAQARDVAGWTAGALGILEAKAALPLLLTTADDPSDFFLRLVSVRSLVAWNVPEAFPVFVRRLDDPLLDIRILALTGLTSLRDRRAVVPVLSRLSDPSPAVRAQAVVALAELGDSTVRPKLEGLRQTETDPDVLGAVEDALARLAR